MNHQKEAVACGYWPLYHYDPRDAEQPFHLDSQQADGRLPRVRDEGGPLRHARPLQARAGRAAAGPGQERHQRPLGSSTSNWPGLTHAGRQRRSGDHPEGGARNGTDKAPASKEVNS